MSSFAGVRTHRAAVHAHGVCIAKAKMGCVVDAACRQATAGTAGPSERAGVAEASHTGAQRRSGTALFQADSAEKARAQQLRAKSGGASGCEPASQPQPTQEDSAEKASPDDLHGKPPDGRLRVKGEAGGAADERDVGSPRGRARGGAGPGEKAEKPKVQQLRAAKGPAGAEGRAGDSPGSKGGSAKGGGSGGSGGAGAGGGSGGGEVLFEKMLTSSDAGGPGRVVIPKVETLQCRGLSTWLTC